MKKTMKKILIAVSIVCFLVGSTVIIYARDYKSAGIFLMLLGILGYLAGFTKLKSNNQNEPRKTSEIPAPVQQNNKNKITMYYCHMCGHSLEDDDKFCPHCGAVTIKNTNCIKCGAPLKEGAFYCNSCGAKAFD